MVDGFEVKVPITIKGGREGEKVGKQIGEKIAMQLQKAFRAINISGVKTGGVSVGKDTGMIGVSKGLKGVATRIGILGVALGVTIGLLRKSSPYLKGILDIFGRAFMMFFRPFGDFLATLLRPMAILMMKMAVAFLSWTRTPEGKATVATVVVVGGILTAAAIGTLASQALAIASIGTAASTATPLVSSFLSKLKLLAGLGLITLGVKLGYDVLKSDEFGAEEVLKTIGAGLALGLGATLLGASATTGITIGIITITAIFGWKYVSAQAAQSKAYRELVPPGMKEIEYDDQTSQMTRQFDQDMDWFEREFGVTSKQMLNKWVEDNYGRENSFKNSTDSQTKALNIFYNESTGKFEKISGSAIDNNLKMGVNWEEGLKDNMENAGIYVTNINSTFDGIDKNILTVHEIRTVHTTEGEGAPKGGTSGGIFGKIMGFLGIGKGQVGIPNVPREGLYHLHPGEEVVPRTKVGQNKSTVFKPTFNITGNMSTDLDMDEVVRRAGRQTEMSLKQRGII